MKIYKKMAIILVIILTTICIFSNFSFATGFDWNSAITDIDEQTGIDDVNTSVKSIVGAAAVVTRIIGVGVAVIMLIVLAIKYMSAAPGDKADIKKHAIVYVVGAVILFAATGILEIIAKFADNV